MESRTIELSRGYKTVVDARDYEELSRYRWSALVQRGGKNVYAVRAEVVDGKKRHVRMHCQLLPGAEVVDHRDGDSLNNRRGNLRRATNQQNVFNAPRPVTNTSGVKGVSWKAEKGLWRGYVTLDGKQHHVGYFLQLEDAEKAVARTRKRLHGSFARCV